MRVSVLAASVVLLIAPVAVAQEPAPAPEAAAVAPPPAEPPVDDQPLDQAEAAPPAEEMKEICRSMRDPRTRMFVRKCETAREREKRLKGLTRRKPAADLQTARAQ